MATYLNSNNQGIQAKYDRERLRQQQIANMNGILAAGGMNNPIGVLGYLIGNGMSQKVYNNGVEKGQDWLDQTIAGYNKPQQADYQAFNQALDTINLANPTATDFSITTNGQQMPATPENPVTIGNGGPAVVDPADVNASYLGISSNLGIPSTTPTPAQNLSDFKEAQLRQQFNEWGRQNGKTETQLDEAWNSRKEAIAGLSQEAKNARFENFLNTYGKVDENGNKFLNLSMDNPDTIKAIHSLIADGNTTAATLFAKSAQANDQRAFNEKQNAIKLAAQAAIADKKLAGALRVADFKNRNKTVKPDNTALNLAYKQYVKLGKEREAFMNNPVNAGKTYEHEEDYQNLHKAIQNTIFGIKPKPQQQYADQNDYGKMTQWVTKQIAQMTSKDKDKRLTRDNITKALVKYWDDNGGSDVIRDVMKDVNWEGYGL